MLSAFQKKKVEVKNEKGLKLGLYLNKGEEILNSKVSD